MVIGFSIKSNMKMLKVQPSKPRTGDEWFEILAGFPKPELSEFETQKEHCPNCKSIITRNNKVSFTNKTVCDQCKDETNN